MPKNERKQLLTKSKEQENNVPINMSPIPFPMMYPMPPRQMPNRFYNNNYRKPKYPSENEQQKRINNQNNMNQESSNQNNSSSADEPSLEKLRSFKTVEEQKDYLGEFLFKKIEQHPIAQSQNLDVDKISRITGMILGIENINEIYAITTNHENITARIKEGLELLSMQ